MSGDLGPRVAILAAKKFLQSEPDSRLILVGDDAVLRPLIKQHLSSFPHVSSRHTANVVAMTDDPFSAFRHKHDSSMWGALALLKQGEASAVVSAGNTGALILMAQHLIRRCEGVDRVALGKFLPTINGSLSYLLDMGASVECNSLQLHQFAVMATVLLKEAGVEKPSVRLLNVGVEEVKGTQVLQQAHRYFLDDNQLNYHGFIEANSLLSGQANIIVCDGFSGNIALKASEGAAHYIYARMHALGVSSIGKRFALLLAVPFLKMLSNDISPSQYNGALLLGLKKPVIKSHGAADEDAFYYALLAAKKQTIADVAGSIERHLSAN